MKIRWQGAPFAALALLCVCHPTGAAVADDVDTSLDPPANHKTLDTSLPQRAPGYSAAERVDELEAARAAVDGKSKSPISLSVSGWINGQVGVGK